MLLWQNNGKLYISSPKGVVINLNTNVISNINNRHILISSAYQPQLVYPVIDILSNKEVSPITHNLFKGIKEELTAGFLYIKDIGVYRVGMYWNNDINDVAINLSLANDVKFISMDDITTDYINNIYHNRIIAKALDTLPFEENGDECFIEMVKYYNEVSPYRQGDIFKMNLDTLPSDESNGYIYGIDLNAPPAEISIEENNEDEEVDDIIKVSDDKKKSTAKKSSKRKSTETN